MRLDALISPFVSEQLPCRERLLSMAARPALGILFALLLIAALWSQSSCASANDPLAISITGSREFCTVGTYTEISWTISGGAAPYALSINGASVDPQSESERVLCLLAEGLDAPRHLYAFDRVVVRATVVDAASRSSSSALVVRLMQPLSPPENASAGVYQDWQDYRVAWLYAGVDRQRYHGSRAQSPPPALYLVRWREAGAATWSYQSEDEPYAGAYYSRSVQLASLNTEFEVQLSQLRDPIEQETPAALRWSRTLTAISKGPPNDVTVQAASRSAVVSWRANQAQTRWRLRIELTGERGRWSSAYEEVDLRGRHSYSVEFDRLQADTWYSITIVQDSHSVLPEATFDFRTQPERTDASRPHDGPIITSAYPATVAKGLAVSWAAPADGPESPYLVYAHEYATPVDQARVLKVATDQREALICCVRPDTLYRVVVANDDLHQSHDEILVRTRPEMASESPPYRWNHPELFVEWRHASDRHQVSNAFFASWAPDYREGYAQVQWQKDGRTMSSYGPEPIVIRVANPGGYRFRARFLKSDRWSSWTPWQHRSTTPRPPSLHSIRVVEAAGQLNIEWSSSTDSLTPADGYRVYLRGQGALEQAFDVGAQTRLSVPIAATQTEYDIQVAAVSNRYGEGARSPVTTFSAGRAPILMTQSTPCDPFAGLPAAVTWDMIGGAVPFLVRVDDQAPLQTTQASGEALVHCEPVPADGPPTGRQVLVSVEDAYGRQVQSQVSVRPIPLAEGQQERSLSFEPITVFSVTNTEAHLGWPCFAWSVYGWSPRPPAQFQLRSRTKQSRSWTYRTIETRTLGPKLGDWCRWTWHELTPGTTYEFQLAHAGDPNDRAMPDGLDWTPLESFTTLTEPQEVVLRRIGDNVEVTWSAQSDAWLYQVVLKGEHHSWWKLHRPNGGPMEHVTFADVGNEDALSVTIISPPEFRRQPLIAPGFHRFIPPH